MRAALYPALKKAGSEGLHDEHLANAVFDALALPFAHYATERAVAKAFGAERTLAETYPELDDANQSDEALAAQQEILRIIEDTFPPETLARNPERVLRMAVEEYRRSYGTPVFAQPPGTSGSPSVRALQAAEASAAQAVGTPLEGTGMPRARQGGPESPIERIKRENRELSKKVATTPSGRPLGFNA